MLRVQKVKAEGPGLSSMSPDKRTNKRITQYYLAPGRGDIPAVTPSRSWYSIKRPRRDARLS